LTKRDDRSTHDESTQPTAPVDRDDRDDRDDRASPDRAPDDSHHGHGHHSGKHHGRRGGGRGRRRAQRGDVRTAILLLLADQPMHGYQLMQAMSERTNGAWRPSPGAVYPTIDQLEDEGLATIQQDGGRRLVTLTTAGRTHLAEHGLELSDPFTEYGGDPAGPGLRDPLDELDVAARQVEVSGTAAQVDAAARVLIRARRSLYLILAGEPDGAAPSPPTKGMRLDD